MKCTELINIKPVILNNKSPLDIYIISKFMLYSIALLTLILRILNNPKLIEWSAS